MNYLIQVVLVCLYCSQSHQQGSRLVGVPIVNPQPWRFTNNSTGLPRAHSVSMSLCRVCMLSSLPVCLFVWLFVGRGGAVLKSYVTVPSPPP